MSFSKTDAWILYSIPVSKKGAELDEIIARADFVNHAIPNPDEIQRAVSKAYEVGLVELSGPYISFSSEYKDWINSVTSKSKYAFDAWMALNKALQKKDWIKTRESNYTLTEQDHKIAYEKYIMKLKKR